ncbi:MAG: TrkH family potassium uptake protein, partial [Clostridia bacterium]|nr:TrkH family potassium uptake protein [Clostridia bacterium]
MKKSLVGYVLGWVLVVIGAMLALPMIVAFVYGENDYLYFGIIAVCCLFSGLIITRFKPKNPHMYPREGFIACALTWILMSVVGCLPFYVSGQIPHFADALFESISGFTTTGATILGTDRQIEDLSKSMLFWRSFTNWAGGMGILVFLLAVITPLSGQSNMH